MPVPFDDVTVIVGSASYPSPLFVKNTSLIDDASASVRVPFYIAVDGSNFALLHSKSQYNIVDAL